MYRKYNSKLLKKITGQPIETQSMTDGTMIYIYSMNDEAFHLDYVKRNVFYAWACDGKDFKIVVDNDYFAEFHELFSIESNIIFIEHLSRLLKYNFINKVVSFSVLGVVFAFLIVSLSLSKIVDLGNYALYAVIGALVATLIVSFLFRKPQQKSVVIFRAQMRELFGDAGINAIIDRQTAFYQRKYYELNPQPAPEEPKVEEENKTAEILETSAVDNNEVADETKEVEENKEEK